MQPETGPHFQEALGRLWHSAIGLAALRGTVSYGPLDPSLPPGNDGSTKPDGEPAAVCEVVVEGVELPAALQAQGISKVRISKYDEARLDGSDLPERVFVVSTETNGIETIVALREKAPGQFGATIDLSLDDENIPEAIPLTQEERQGIIDDMLNGNDFWLRLEGPAGDFARRLHVIFSVDHTPTLDDIRRMQGIVAALE